MVAITHLLAPRAAFIESSVSSNLARSSFTSTSRIISVCPRRPHSSSPRSIPSIFLSAATPNTPDNIRPTKKSSRSRVPINLFNIRFSIRGRHLLSIVPIIYASFLASAKLLYILPRALSPASFNASRLIVSSLFFLPTLLPELSRLRRKRAAAADSPRLPHFLTAGVELGALMFTANLAQITGLGYTDASRAAFLNQLSTVFVPLTAAAVGTEVLTAKVGAGALCALAGVGLLTLGSGVSSTAVAVTKPWLGDLLEVLAAVITTVYMLRVSHHAKKITGKMRSLVAVKVVMQAILSLIWASGGWLLKKLSGEIGVGVVATTTTTTAVLGKWTVVAVLMNVGLVLWAGIVVGAGTSWMQTRAQASVPAGETAILLSAAPLWTAVIAMLALGERMGKVAVGGAGLILAGTIVSGMGEKDKEG